MRLKRITGLFVLLLFLLSGCRSDSFVEPQTKISYLTLPSTVENVEEQLNTSMARLKDDIKKILAIKHPNFENTAHALNDALYTNNNIINIHSTAYYLSPVDRIRQAAQAANLENQAAQRLILSDRNLYETMVLVSGPDSGLSEIDQRLADNLLSMFEENGVHLVEADRFSLESITAEIKILETQFQDNVTNHDDPIVFTSEALKDLPENELANLTKLENGDYEMDPRLYYQYSPIMTYTENEAVRKKAYIAYYSVAKDENPDILAYLVKLRERKASLLNYSNYADLQLRHRMAGSAEKAMDFLETLSFGLEAKMALEKKTLLDMKIAHTTNPDATLQPWDISFYQNRYLAENVDLDQNAMKKYFSLDRCLEGMFTVFESVFRIEIRKATIPPEELWHEDVQVFEVWDRVSDTLLGIFYTDLFPRKGKYPHFATDFTCSGNTFMDGRTETPAGILIGNWSKPENDNPSLLSFSELTTLFHEFGHTLHLLLMDTKYASLHHNAWDFMEVPSQMFERWCLDQTVLSGVAFNVQDPAETLPEDYTDKIRLADTAFGALSIGSQVAFAMTDLMLHTDFQEADDVNPDIVFKTNSAAYFLPQPDETSKMARFIHLTGGYDAGYYSYLWSQAIVNDFMTVFEATSDKLMDSDTGMRLRQEIFMPGKTRAETESVRVFLGRDWNTDAYIRYQKHGAI